MNIVKKMSKKKLLETYKNNYELMLNRKNELYNKNIELQKDKIEQDKIIANLKKENRVLKGKLTKAKNELNKYKANAKIELAPSIENGNKIVEEILKDQEISKARGVIV